MKRFLRTAGVVTAAVLLTAGGAGAGTILDRTSQALQTDPVYVDPAAQPSITPAERAKLESEIAAQGDGPIYIAVLPAAARSEAGGDAGEALRDVADGVNRRGVYALVAGGQFRAGATGDTGLDRGEAPKLATKAYDAHHDEGLGATLLDFVDRVGDARQSGGSSGGGGGSGGGFPWWLLAVLGGIATFVVLRRRRRAAARRTAFAEVKAAAREDLVALASDVQELEDDVESNPRANQAYMAALDHYGRASGAFDRARTADQLEPVANALEEGRYEMAVAKAVLAGAPEPERRAPCFFDPRHGPSVRDVSWSPPGGATREVPACAACALRIEEGDEPETRQVLAGGRSVPYWSAGPAFGGYFGGFFPGLLIGEAFGGFGGWGGPVVVAGSDDNGGNTNWGDSGDLGGGFGSGDFGGGGGDFGGGDFGGGGDSGGGGGDF